MRRVPVPWEGIFKSFLTLLTIVDKGLITKNCKLVVFNYKTSVGSVTVKHSEVIYDAINSGD